jgi:hypothetical protein
VINYVSDSSTVSLLSSRNSRTETAWKESEYLSLDNREVDGYSTDGS